MRRRVAVAAVSGLAVVAGGLIGWHELVKDIPIQLPLGRSCAVSGAAGDGRLASDGPEVTLDDEQMANAATISAIGIRRGVPARAVVIALATAWQESKLENLSGGDRDSVGLFQQRPSQGWGRPEQLMDPRYAANAFYASLAKVSGWERMRVTEAAQAVQRSAHPEAYEQWADKAEVLTRALSGDAAGAVNCVIVGEPTRRGTEAAEALASSVRLDWGEIRTVAVGDVPGLGLAVRDQRAGWQYAHWLVAHAQQHGIRSVRFADREWTAKRGAWQQATRDPTPGTGERVVAEVY